MTRASALAVALFAAACNAAIDDLTDGVLLLPPQLREVSGMAVADATTVVCVQDEAGALFFVDLTGRTAPRVEVFGPPGDYEGLAKVGDDWWVLRADGVLLRVVRRAGALAIVAEVSLPAGHGDWEGLAADPARGLLLAMPKDRAKDGGRHLRPIVAVDPVVGAVRGDAGLVIDMRTLAEAAVARGIDLPTRTTPKGRQKLDLALACSELLVVPGSGDLLLLSAVDHALVRVDREGKLVGFRALDEGHLPQPEGLALLPDGRLLVASEGTSHGVLRVTSMP